MSKVAWGVVLGLGAVLGCTAAMVPIRTQLSVATCALVLVVPVVLGVAVGGFVAGSITVVGGFLAYDWFFIPPYGTLEIGQGQNWVALFVYVIVMLVVARVVAFQVRARDLAASRALAISQLFTVSQSLTSDKPLQEMLDLVVTTVHQTFATTWVAVLLPDGNQLRIAATAGLNLSPAERAEIETTSPTPTSLTLTSGPVPSSRIALSATSGPVGQLVLAGADLDLNQRALLRTFANQAAVAIERSQLQAQATKTQLLEELDRWRSALIGAVSHDLRTPLASVKSAVSTLRSPELTVSDADEAALLSMIEEQTDHLARLVTNLLDAARLETGTLVLRREVHSVDEVIGTAIASLGTALDHHELRLVLDADLPLVDVDLVLCGQIVANLLSNAAHHGPEGTVITVTAQRQDAVVMVSVADQGPGVEPQDREKIFQMVDRIAGSGRAGLGLSLSTAFAQAHGQHLTVDDAPGGGARFSLPLEVAELEEDL